MTRVIYEQVEMDVASFAALEDEPDDLTLTFVVSEGSSIAMKSLSVGQVKALVDALVEWLAE